VHTHMQGASFSQLWRDADTTPAKTLQQGGGIFPLLRRMPLNGWMAGNPEYEEGCLWPVDVRNRDREQTFTLGCFPHLLFWCPSSVAKLLAPH